MRAGDNIALLTDLYQLTMAQTYFREQRLGSATFSLFIRSYPTHRSYYVSAGLRDVMEYLEDWSFDAEALEKLKTAGMIVIQPDVGAFRRAAAGVCREAQWEKRWGKGFYDRLEAAQN